MMKIKILWLYHDIKDVFGDEGNIQVLKQRAIKRGFEVEVETCGIGEEIKDDSYDLVYMGTNISYEDQYLFEDVKKKKPMLEVMMKQNKAFLLVSGGFQLFGNRFVGKDGEIVEGLGLLPYASDYRNLSSAVGNICIESDRFGKIIGFENHQYQIIDVDEPLGKVLVGCGNTYHNDYEGYMKEGVIATSIHGPLLPKNTRIADYLLKHICKQKNVSDSFKSISNRFEEDARRILLKRMNLG